jgi:hypothetical protein
MDEDKKSLVEDMVDYILQSESEDFYENPSTTHVYYKALAYVFGFNYANKELNKAFKGVYNG